MLKFIKILFEIITPVFLIFVVFPRVIDMVKEMLDISEKPKKKSKKPNLTHSELMTIYDDARRLKRKGPPPPPPSRMVGGNTKSQRVYSEDGNSFTENGKSYTKSDELGWDIPWYKEDEKPKTEPQPKNKHFKKGVNPDFL